jgi:beta-glucosidase
MTIDYKTSQLMQGDIVEWLNTATDEFSAAGLAGFASSTAGHFYVGHDILELAFEWYQGCTGLPGT